MELKYFSTFSGIGGFELGIQQAYERIYNSSNNTRESQTERELPTEGEGVAGKNSQSSNNKLQPDAVVCVGFSEIDKYATQIYKKHFPRHKNYGDITTINASELPDFDLLVGGFPCQSFSIAGKRKGFEDTRGTLFFDLARILQAKQPELFIFENVKGLLSHDNGQTFKTIIATLVELGYCVEWQVLNSKNHGVPQNRERVFIVGHIGGFGGRQVFPIGKSNAILNKDKIQKLAKSMTSSMHKGVGNDGMTLVADYRYDEGLRIKKKFISPCLTSTHKENGFSAKPPIINPYNSKSLTKISSYQIRRLTPTECERLQGFPDGWTEGISDSQRYKCLGNAVTVNVISEIIKKMHFHFLKQIDIILVLNICLY